MYNKEEMDSMMKQTYKELMSTARAENVPYSGTNKSTLSERILHYRATHGSLYRENTASLKVLARREGIRGYSALKKGDLVDSILFHRRVVKPRIAELQGLTKKEIRTHAKQAGVKVIGGRKDRMMANLARHQVGRLKSIIEDVACEEYKPLEIKGAFNGGYKRYRSKGVDSGAIVSVEGYLEKVRRHVLKKMKDLVANGVSWKFQLNIVPEFAKLNEDDGLQKPVWSSSHVITEGSNLTELIEEMYRTILSTYETVSLALNSSNYVFDHIVEMSYHCHKVDLVRGGSYIELPDWVNVKKCAINPKNADEECFKWAVLAAVHREDLGAHQERIAKLRAYEDRYNWEGITFPTPASHWSKFERQNPEVALNILYGAKHFIC